jgi:hypothetical protein
LFAHLLCTFLVVVGECNSRSLLHDRRWRHLFLPPPPLP